MVVGLARFGRGNEMGVGRSGHPTKDSKVTLFPGWPVGMPGIG